MNNLLIQKKEQGTKKKTGFDERAGFLDVLQ